MARLMANAQILPVGDFLCMTCGDLLERLDRGRGPSPDAHVVMRRFHCHTCHRTYQVNTTTIIVTIVEQGVPADASV